MRGRYRSFKRGRMTLSERASYIKGLRAPEKCSKCKALRADLEVLAVAARDFTEETDHGVRHYDALRKALALPGVVAALEKHGRRGEGEKDNVDGM